MMKRGFFWLGVVLLLGLLMLLAVNFPYQNLGGAKLSITPQTTHLLGPFTQYGTVDYAAAINQRQMEGVTTENNVVAEIFRFTPAQFFGNDNDPQDVTIRDRFAKALGYTETPEPIAITDPEQLIHDRFKDTDDDPQKMEEVNSELQTFRTATQMPWKSETFPESAALLKEQKEKIDLLREAASRTKYFHPIILPSTEQPNATILNAGLPIGQRFRQCSRILVLRALNGLGDGSPKDIESAIADLQAARRLGWLQCQSVSLIEKLIACAIFRTVSDAESQMLACRKLTPQQLQDYQAFVAQHPYPIDIAHRVDFGERLTLLDQAQALLLGPLQINSFFGINYRTDIERRFIQGTVKTADINSALETINQWFDQYTKVLQQSDVPIILEQLDALENKLGHVANSENYTAILWEIFRGPKSRGRFIGNVITAMFLPYVAHAARADFDNHTLSRLSEIAFAIGNFQSKYDRLPNSLDELTPEFLDRPPVDPYQDSPLNYICRDGGFMIYSVGPDGVDNGGRLRNEVEKGGEYDIRVAVKIQPEIEKGSQEDRRIRNAESERRYWKKLREQKAKQSKKDASQPGTLLHDSAARPPHQTSNEIPVKPPNK